MGLRFRKSVPFGKFLRLNFSKSGLSVGVGPPGLNMNIGPRGIRRTVGIPGTGVSWQETQRWARPDSSPGAAPQDAHGGSGSGSGLSWRWIALFALLVAAAVSKCGQHSSAPVSSPTDRAVVSAVPHPAPAPSSPAPAADRELTRDEIRELQTLLRKQGFGPVVADGLAGPRTSAALQAFAHARGLKGPAGLSPKSLQAARVQASH